MNSKSVSQIFKTLFQIGDINIFLSAVSFLDEKNSGEIWDTLERSYQNLTRKVLKENSIIGRSWSSAKFFIMQNYTDNANGDVPLT